MLVRGPCKALSLAALALAAAVAVTGCPSREAVVGAPISEVVLPAADASAPAPVVAGRAAAADDKGLVGRWVGVGTQGDGQSWEMIVDIQSTAVGRCATVEYPSIPCSAEWICLAGTTATHLRAREDLTDGVGRCIDHGMMTMSVASDGTLDWRWNGSGDKATARLTRQSR